jgi:hypothetical protein
MAFSIEFLSSSLSGEPVPLAATTSPGTTLHSGVAGTTQKDEVFIYANNTGVSLAMLVLEVGGTGVSNRIFQTLTPQDGYQLVYQGFPINNNAVIRAYSPSGANLIITQGYAQRGP